MNAIVNTILQQGYDLLDRVSTICLVILLGNESTLSLTLSGNTQGLVPDFILRRVIRLLLHQRLREINHGSVAANHAAKMEWIARSKARQTIADVPEKANEQHYEVRLCSFPHFLPLYT